MLVMMHRIINSLSICMQYTQLNIFHEQNIDKSRLKFMHNRHKCCAQELLSGHIIKYVRYIIIYLT